MYNLRYHVASIVSVFLALAIGLVLGGLIADRTPTKGQEVLIESIQKEVAITRETNTRLNEATRSLTTFSADLSNDYIAKKLEGKTVLVLGGRGQSRNAAVSALEAAGAEVVMDQPKLDDTGMWRLSEKDDKPAGFDAVVNVLEPDKEQETSYFTFLQGLGTVSGASGTLPPVSASLDDDSTLAATSWEHGIAATNQLKTPYGAYSLVALLLGAKPELYGSSDKGAALYPALPLSATP